MSLALGDIDKAALSELVKELVQAELQVERDAIAGLRASIVDPLLETVNALPLHLQNVLAASIANAERALNQIVDRLDGWKLTIPAITIGPIEVNLTDAKKEAGPQ